jgi:hypothetical protein
MKNLNLLVACFIMRDAPALRMALVSNKEAKATSSLMPQRTNFLIQDREGYILCPKNYPEHKIRKIHVRKPHNVSHHAFMYRNEASSSRHSTHIKIPKKKIPNASNEHNISFKTFDASWCSLTNQAK